MNPLFNNNSQPNNPFQNFSETLNSFNQFRNTFNGNPKQIVMNMLQNGQMSQQQFSTLQQMANQFMRMMH